MYSLAAAVLPDVGDADAQLLVYACKWGVERAENIEEGGGVQSDRWGFDLQDGDHGHGDGDAGDDFAFDVACDVRLVDPLPEPPDEYPAEIGVGIYIVGIDIQPGLYQGTAGEDISDSCYWARLRDVSGSLDDVIANDNAIGQYFVQVSDADFGLKTGCNLTRVGD